MTTARTLTALALTAALSPLLAACSDDAISAPPASAPTTAATSATPTPSASPDLSIAPPGETAQEFVRRWIALGNELQTTGDPTDVLAVSGPDCLSCQRFASAIQKIYSQGGRIEGGTDTIVSVRSESPTQWLVDLRALPTTRINASGKRTVTYTGGPYTTRLLLAEINGRWIVTETETVGQ